MSGPSAGSSESTALPLGSELYPCAGLRDDARLLRVLRLALRRQLDVDAGQDAEAQARPADIGRRKAEAERTLRQNQHRRRPGVLSDGRRLRAALRLRLAAPAAG